MITAINLRRGLLTGITVLVTLYDTPREGTPKLIQKLRNLGVRVKMLVSGAKTIAKEISRTN